MTLRTTLLKEMMALTMAMLVQGGVVAATFVVNNVADDADAHDANPGDGICSDAQGACTLRAAMEEANATAALDTILFLSVFSNATVTVNATEGPLPFITNRVFILGESIDAYNSSAMLLSDAPPQIFIDGNQLSGAGENGVVFLGAAASGSILSAVGIVNFGGDGILVSGADDLIIDRNYIGTMPNGAVAGNGGHGVHSVSSGEHRIGKGLATNNQSFTGLGNVISNNGRSGIRLESSSMNDVRGNLIGLGPAGSGDRGNGEYGIHISGSSNGIGDFTAKENAGNFIAGNNLGSVLAVGNDNHFFTNTLGKGETGGFVASGGDGFAIIGSNNFIGGGGRAQNKVYEHVASAVRVGVSGGTAANSNFVVNNQIGSPGSQFPLLLSGNGAGINVANGNTNAILDNRVINSTGNSSLGLVGNGIAVRGNNNTVSGNQVGFVIALFGPRAEPNQQGIVVIGDNNNIGSMTRPNTVGANSGIGIGAFGDGNKVHYNYIGVTESYANIGNASTGLVVQNASIPSVLGNIIGFNDGTGLFLNSVDNAPVMASNWIGIAPNGANIGNAADGVRIQQSTDADLQQNHIAFNGGNGIVTNSSISGIAWFQNAIHSNDGIGIDLEDDGVTANDAGDVDEGANRLQNFPVIVNAVLDRSVDPSTLTITYRVDSDAGTASYPIFVDFYWSDIDESAQGRYFLGTDFDYNTANMLEVVTFDMATDVFGGWLTATALEQGRNTSELAARFMFGDPDELLFKDDFENVQ